MDSLRAAPLAFMLACSFACGGDPEGSDEADAAGDMDDADSLGEDDDDGVADGSCDDPAVHTGEGTWYELNGNPVNCGYPTDQLQPYYAALNSSQYGNADYCGACLEVRGPAGSVELMIVDQCPTCAHGDVDLSPAAFEQIAALEEGRVDIEWNVVPCSTTPDAMSYRIKEGSSQWWTAIQVVGHKTPLAKLEARQGDAWVEVPRLDYNYFVADQGLGEGPYDLRITDVLGQSVEDSGIPLVPDESLQPGTAQFSGCE